MHYDPFTPSDNIFNKVKYLIEYCDMENCTYYHPQVISKDYNIIRKTGKFQEYIKTWDRLTLIQKTRIAFKTHFRKSHLELTETGELTLEQYGYGQDKPVEEIVSCL